MNPDPGSLDNLRDIVELPAVSWWPLAPGWWIVIALVAVIAAVNGMRAWKQWKANAYRRAALEELRSAGALTDGTARKRNSGKRLPSYVQTARDGLASIAAKTGIASHHLALLWLLGSGRNLIPIVGARTSDQLTEMVQAISASLDAEIIDEISGLATPKLPFPTKLIESDYLRTFALGTPERYDKPWPSRC